MFYFLHIFWKTVNKRDRERDIMKKKGQEKKRDSANEEKKIALETEKIKRRDTRFEEKNKERKSAEKSSSNQQKSY